jgi:hypothetical protein
VAVNGVPIYDYSSQGTLDLAAYDPRFDTVLTGELDQCNGHSGRGDVSTRSEELLDDDFGR